MGAFVDLTGKTFGYLTVLSRAQTKKHKVMWNCICNCGNKVIVDSHSLKSGNTKSCGCYQREAAGRAQRKHGEANASRLYNIWTNMKVRCNCPTHRDYPGYGGRGITVCHEWNESYKAFKDWALANGYNDSLTIDRIDNDGNYSPENCRWTTVQIQNNNTRNNRLLTYNGKTQSIANWARETQIPYDTLCGRLRNGWIVEDALTTPVKSRSKLYSERLLTYNGRTQRLSAWAKEFDLLPHTLQRRIDALGWSVEKALTTPVKQKNNKKNAGFT